MSFKNKWALILGGSSGFGLQTAKKLSSQGMNICVVHRDRRGAMERINKEFQEIRDNKVKLISYNENALEKEVQEKILDDFTKQVGKGQIGLLMHSIALGNLKLLAPRKQTISPNQMAVGKLAEALQISEKQLQTQINTLFEQGLYSFHSLSESPVYNDELLLGDEDIANTAYAMGTSLITWVQELFTRELFADYVQVVGLTSEGNEVAWLGYAAVSIAKCALEAASRSIAREFAPYGIRSNIIQAGVTYTPALQFIPGSSHIVAKAFLSQPGGRLTQPSDVANVISLLCTQEAYWINGSLIKVDCGESISK